MKPVYLMMISSCISMAVFTTSDCFAQCTCWTGAAATPVVSNFTLPQTNVSSATLTFNQMNPSLGDLNCLKFDYNISGQTTVGVRNYASSTALLAPTDPIYSPTGRLLYKFVLNVAPDIEGPGISEVNPFSKNYTDSLGAHGQPDDTITYGPDPIFTNFIGSVSKAGGNASYLGTGTVTMSYSISGGLSTIKGGTNFSQKIITDYQGDFKLSYFYCPAQPLATGITNFTVTKSGEALNILWSSDDINNTLYEVQISTNGSEFTPLGQKQSNPATAGTPTEYKYQYHLNKTDVGKLYFRLKRVEPGGKTSFSAILLVDMTKITDEAAAAAAAFTTYPNPVKDNLVFQFTESQTGQYLLELINTVGQVVQQKAATLNGSTQIRLDLNGHPSKGLYYLRTRDITHNKSYLTKILIN